MSLTSTMTTTIMGEKVKPLRVKRDVDMSITALKLSGITIPDIEEDVKVTFHLHWFRPKVSVNSKGKTVKGQSDVGSSEEIEYDLAKETHDLDIKFNIGGGLTFNDNYTKPKEKILHIDVVFSKKSEVEEEKSIKIGTVCKSIDLAEVYCGEMRTLLKKLRKNSTGLSSCTSATVQLSVDLEGAYGGLLLIQFTWNIDPNEHFPTLDPIKYQQKLLAASNPTSIATTEPSAVSSAPLVQTTDASATVQDVFAVTATKKTTVKPVEKESSSNEKKEDNTKQEKIEKEKMEKEEKEKVEREKERLEKIEKEKAEADRIEKERLEAEKKLQEEEERKKKEKIEAEKKAAYEKAQLEKKMEEERLEEERKQKEKEEKEELEKKKEAEKKEKEFKEKQERERLEQQKKELEEKAKMEETVKEIPTEIEQPKIVIEQPKRKSLPPPPPPPPPHSSKQKEKLVMEKKTDTKEDIIDQINNIGNEMNAILTKEEKKLEKDEIKIEQEHCDSANSLDAIKTPENDNIIQSTTDNDVELDIEVEGPVTQSLKQRRVSKNSSVPLENIMNENNDDNKNDTNIVKVNSNDQDAKLNMSYYIGKLKTIYALNDDYYSSIFAAESDEETEKIITEVNKKFIKCENNESDFSLVSSYSNSFILNMPFKSPVSKSVTTVANELGLSLQRRMMFPIRIHILKSQQSKAQSAGSITAPILLSVLKKKIPVDYKYVIRSILTTCSSFSEATCSDPILPIPNVIMNLSIPQSILPDSTTLTHANLPSAFMHIFQAMSVWGAFNFQYPEMIMEKDFTYNTDYSQQTKEKNEKYLYKRIGYQFNGNIQAYSDYLKDNILCGQALELDSSSLGKKKDSKKDNGPTNIDDLPETLQSLGAAQCIVTGINNVTTIPPRLPVSIEMVLGRVVVQSIHTNDWIKPNPADVISFIIEELRINIKTLLFEGSKSWISPTEFTATKGANICCSKPDYVSIANKIEIEIEEENEKEKSAELLKNSQIKSNERILMSLRDQNPIAPRISNSGSAIEKYLSIRKQSIDSDMYAQQTPSTNMVMQMSRVPPNDQMTVFKTRTLKDIISRSLIALSHAYTALLLAKSLGIYAAGNSSVSFKQMKKSILKNDLFDNVVLCDINEFYNETELLSKKIFTEEDNLYEDNLEQVLFRCKNEKYGPKSYSHCYTALMAIYVKTICRITTMLSNAIWIESLTSATKISSSKMFNNTDYLRLNNGCCGRQIENIEHPAEITSSIGTNVYLIRDVYMVDPVNFTTTLSNLTNKTLSYITKLYNLDGTIDSVLTTLILRQISAKFINAIVQSTNAYISNNEVIRRQKGKHAIKPVSLDSPEFTVYGTDKPYYIPFIHSYNLKLNELVGVSMDIAYRPLSEAKKMAARFKSTISEIIQNLTESGSDQAIASIKKTSELVNFMIISHKKIINDILINYNIQCAPGSVQAINLNTALDPSIDASIDKLQISIPSITMFNVMYRLLTSYSQTRINTYNDADIFVKQNQYTLVNPIVIDTFLASLDSLIKYRTEPITKINSMLNEQTTVCSKLLGKEINNNLRRVIDEELLDLRNHSVSQDLISSSNLNVAQKSLEMMNNRMSEWVNDDCYFISTENIIFNRVLYYSHFKQAIENNIKVDDDTFIVRYINSADLWMILNLLPWGLPINEDLYQKLRVIPECTFIKPPLSWV